MKNFKTILIVRTGLIGTIYTVLYPLCSNSILSGVLDICIITFTIEMTGMVYAIFLCIYLGILKLLSIRGTIIICPIIMLKYLIFCISYYKTNEIFECRKISYFTAGMLYIPISTYQDMIKIYIMTGLKFPQIFYFRFLDHLVSLFLAAFIIHKLEQNNYLLEKK